VTLGLGLLPIAPILLLPFILVFFVVVFPIWGVSLGLVGLFLLIMMAIDAIARAAGVDTFAGAVVALRRALRWVLTFGGFTDRYSQKKT
jgi:hypothetical protein